MELFYIDNIVNNDQFDAEYYYFIINYLIGEKIHIHSNFGMYIYGTINANQLTQIELIDYHESYWIHQKKLPKEELQGIFVIKDYYIEHHKYIKEIKAKKHLNKTDIAFINAQKKLLIDVRINVLYVFKAMLEKENIFPYIDLIKNEIFKLSFSIYDRKNVALDEYIGELIYSNFLTKENLFVLGSMLNKQMKILCGFEEEAAKNEDKETVDLESLLLFRIPCSTNLTKENLIVLRKQFHPKINSLFSKIQDLRISFIKMQLNNETIKKYTDFGVSIKQELEEIQNEIDKHVYFQNIKNSDSSFQNVNVYLGIIPIDLLLNVYGSFGVLTFSKMLELRHITAIANRKRDVEIYLKYVKDTEDDK